MSARLSKEEFESAYRIFNHVENVIGPYYGRKLYSDIEKFCSENRWIMFPECHIESLREGVSYPVPNVFVSFDDKICDVNGRPPVAWIGVTYHNVDAMIGLAGLLKRKKKAECFIGILGGLGGEWFIEFQHKTKTDCPNSTPHYDTVESISPDSVSIDAINDAWSRCESKLLNPNDEYPKTGTPIIWSVSIFVVAKRTTIKTFDDDAKKSFDVFFKCLSLR